MNKFIYSKNTGFKNTPYCHANYIRQEGFAYDIVIRGLVFDKLKIVYIRINDLSVYQGLEYKQVIYKFDNNLKACEAYLKKSYKKYKIYTSYNINELPLQLREDILNS